VAAWKVAAISAGKLSTPKVPWSRFILARAPLRDNGLIKVRLAGINKAGYPSPSLRPSSEITSKPAFKHAALAR